MWGKVILGELCIWGIWAGDRRKLSVLSDEFSCEPITAIENKVHLNGKFERKNTKYLTKSPDCYAKYS